MFYFNIETCLMFSPCWSLATHCVKHLLNIRRRRFPSIKHSIVELVSCWVRKGFFDSLIFSFDRIFARSTFLSVPFTSSFGMFDCVEIPSVFRIAYKVMFHRKCAFIFLSSSLLFSLSFHLLFQILSQNDSLNFKTLLSFFPSLR